jgi:hypothetical protein
MRSDAGAQQEEACEKEQRLALGGSRHGRILGAPWPGLASVGRDPDPSRAGHPSSAEG